MPPLRPETVLRELVRRIEADPAAVALLASLLDQLAPALVGFLPPPGRAQGGR